MRAMRTIEEQNIEQVAGRIYETRTYVGPWERDAIEKQNAEGWTIDVCYDQQAPYQEGWFTRVTDLTLSGRALGDAIALAEAWERGEF